MANVIYSNFVLENKIENMYKTKLDALRFCVVDDSLVGTAGEIKKVHKYNATDSTQVLAMGAGNSQTTEVSFTEKAYNINLYQNRFSYYDEEEMTDPMVVQTGVNGLAAGMFNKIDDAIVAEFGKAEWCVQTGSDSTAISTNNFIDAVAKLDLDNTDDAVNSEMFAFVSVNTAAAIRKALKTDLQYVTELMVRKGYIGTINNVNVYTKKNVPDGTVLIGVRGAVTYFVKKGTEIEQDRDKNIRKNTIYSRKYGVPALTDANKCVKIVVGKEIAASPDTATVAVGDTADLSENITLQSGSALTWASSDIAKATVDADGVVTGVASGSVNITATTVNGNIATIAVTVS